MFKSVKLALVMAPFVAASGCATVENTFMDSVASVGPKADQKQDGSYVLPTFSVPDNGTEFSTSNPSQSLAAIVSPLTKKEKIYFARVFVSLAQYHGCVEHGYRTYGQSNSRFVSKIGNPKTCNMRTVYPDSLNFARGLLATGRPDADIARTSQLQIGAAKLGDPVTKGHGSASAWNIWTEWSGHNLDDKTRSDLMQDFLTLSKGTYGTQTFVK